MSVFSDWLKEKTEAGEISQNELALRINKTQAQMSRWKNGLTDPQINTVEEVLKEMGYHLEIVRDAEELEKPVGVEIEGSAYFWWYVCEECHVIVTKNAQRCMCCGKRLTWE